MNFVSPNNTKAKKNKLLIVEDSEYVARQINELVHNLENIDTISHAFNHAETTALINQSAPDIVLLDIGLPDKSGLDILHLLKEEYPETKVIMLTNNGGNGYRNFCKRIGADYFLDKSNEFERLPDIVSSL